MQQQSLSVFGFCYCLCECGFSIGHDVVCYACLCFSFTDSNSYRREVEKMTLNIKNKFIAVTRKETSAMQVVMREERHVAV